MRLYICKNNEFDGDIHFAVFTTEAKAKEFCRSYSAFNGGNDWLYYLEVDMTNDIEAEFIKYTEGRMK